MKSQKILSIICLSTTSLTLMSFALPSVITVYSDNVSLDSQYGSPTSLDSFEGSAHCNLVL